MEEFELEPGEHVVLSVRQHILILIFRLIPIVILAFLPFFISVFFTVVSSVNPQAASFGIGSLSPPLGNVVEGVWLLGLWTAAFSMFTRYWLTVWTITNLRIVDIRQRGFFSREVSSFLLVRVQDVTTDISGMLGTLVGFGRLSVETAGKDEEFFMDAIVHPEYIRDVIMSQVAILHPAVPTAESAADGL